jgi:hypothetical protein
MHSVHSYEVRPRKDRRGFDLISDALPFGRLWYDGPEAVANAIGYAQHRSRSHDAYRHALILCGQIEILKGASL